MATNISDLIGNAYTRTFRDQVDGNVRWQPNLKLSVIPTTTKWEEMQGISKGVELARLKNSRGVFERAEAGIGMLKAHVYLTKGLLKGINQQVYIQGPEDYPGFYIDISKEYQVFELGKKQPSLLHSEESGSRVYRLKKDEYKGIFQTTMLLKGKVVINGAQLWAEDLATPPFRRYENGISWEVVGEVSYNIDY